MAKVSVLIPSRNELFLTNTIEDVLSKSVGDIEVIVNVDENWPDKIIEDIVLLISDQRTNTALFSISGSSIIRESTGIYYHDFTVPVGTGNIVYEWSGTMEGSPIVNRGLLTREWLRL